jgi:solute carrier family 44 protein 1 (choline transporter-like protein)/choline transporter-like protein 2/4/5
VLLGSLGFSFIIAIIYLIIVRFCAGIIAYITILLIEAALLGLGYVFYARWQYYVSVKDANYELTMKVLCGLFFGLAGVFFLIIVFMCNRIRLAIALVQVTAKYLASTCSVFFVPFIFYTISAFYYCYWVALSVYIYSSGTVTKSDGTFLPQVQWNSTTRYAWWYHLFALFYINAFLNAYNQFVLASSACVWYFEHRIEGGPVRPVSKGFYRGIRYHLGSIAFGSLIVAIIRFLMAVVEYIKQKVDSSGVTDKAGKIFKCLLTCCQCCLECIARLVEYINKHAYIQVSFILSFRLP